jgi:iron-sulfur cluster assembly accessory protein
MEESASVRITPAAAAQLQPLISVEEKRTYLRLYVAGQGCCSYRYGLAFDEKVDDGDSVVEAEGIRVAVETHSAPACEGATIDFVNTSEGTGFVVRGVKTGGGCTCGRVATAIDPN